MFLPDRRLCAAYCLHGRDKTFGLQAPVEGGLAAGSSPKFHRPVPGLSMQAGTTATTAAHRPFTVTTGVPRFARGAPL